MMVATKAVAIRIDMILSARSGKQKTVARPRPARVDVYSRLFMQRSFLDCESANSVSPAAETTAWLLSFSTWSVLQIPLVLDTKCIGSARGHPALFVSMEPAVHDP
jgi:hypothetical protein